MNGIHDVGGMDGFGPVEIEEDEPTFHEPWEGRVYGLFTGTLGQGMYEMDEFRHGIERMDPEHYLDASYYERWLTAIETLLVEKGVVTPDELAARLEAAEAEGVDVIPEREEPGLYEELVEGVTRAYDSERERQDPAFEPGDEVVVRNEHPKGHTRCPRYARGAVGTVMEERGTFVLPDANAHGEEVAEPVYNVRFEGQELWGTERSEGSSVRLDMWESYLESP